MKLLDGVKGDATLSPCGTYRYALSRGWFPKRNGPVLWVMLNPSTAAADVDDPTVRRCQTFARTWGHDGAIVVNLFALRSTNPRALYSHPDPVGPINDDIIHSLASSVPLVVAAWGAHGALMGRDVAVRDLLLAAGRPIHCLGLTKAGQPRHPLYVPGDQAALVWRER